MVKVSLCLPTYNRSHYLTYSITSVLKQTYEDFELIVCDDASPDNTAEVVKNFNDSRIRYIRHEENIGRSRNMRAGFAASRGEYFIKFDDDDALTPDFLCKTVTILDSHPDIDFVCTNHWIIDKYGNKDITATDKNSAKWGKDKLHAGVIEDLLWQTFYYQSLQVGSTLFRRDCLQSVDYMRPEADGCEDFDLLVRLALDNKRGYFLPEYLMEYRFHGGQSSLKQAVHFLGAKAFCLQSYRFTDTDLERERILKLASIQETLGLRLIEGGDVVAGRGLLRESAQVLTASKRRTLGLFLSYLPLNLRRIALENFRKVKPKDYTEQVREII
ncbi:MAG: hypothetical protein N5P05_003407 [Chroococcopsis gigantea SAG 12.99]|jgi:glycosyltransferase involved in cell wall biosynthesis|nr:glycosyltransferase family 2 protein [Chlorogloea purpurea SAG 13.99]MDV3001801.1 hypothetical protein [Chroococcopsis gigantea SAG 12.99]